MLRLLLAVVVTAFAATSAFAQALTPEQKSQLAPAGSLRAALVKIPFLVRLDASGQPRGVAPEIAAELARVLGVSNQPMVFETPNVGIAAVHEGKADVTFLAPTPERQALIDFGPAFMEMDVTLIVPGSSPIKTLADADQPGRRIVVYERTANDEMVQKHVKRATIIRVPIFASKKAFEMIRAHEADGFVELRDQLMHYQNELPGARIMTGYYGRNALAIGYAKNKPAAAAYIAKFTAIVAGSGFVTRAIERAGVRGAVAPGS